MKKTLMIGALIGALAFGGAAAAHTVWLRPQDGRPGVFRVYFGGHEGRLDPYRADKLKTVKALDVGGRELAVTRSGGDNALELTVAGTPAMILVHFDNGIHTRTGTGPSVERPMNEVPGAISATSAVKYHKTVVRWGSRLVTRSHGQPFEVIPQSAEQPRAGQPMRVQVRIDGRPAAGVKIGRGEDDGSAVTDARGMASFTPVAGFNRIWAGKRIPQTGNPRFTELSYEYALGFDAR